MYDERDDARNPITFATFSGLSMRPKGIWRMRRRVNSSPNELPRYVDKVRAFCCRASFADKLTRFGPFSSQCRAGNVKIRRGSWNEELFRVLEGFPDLAHDDEVDACSGALEMLNPQMNSWGTFELYRRQAEAAAERSKPQPVQSVPQPGSMEWFEEQKKKG